MYKIYDLELTTKSPFYSGEIKSSVKEAKRREHRSSTRIDNGHAVINIHGPMRAYLEKILRNNGENVCDTGKSGAKPCGKCVICDLFGSLGKSGRIMVDDLVSERPASEIVDNATHIRLDRENKTATDTLTNEEVNAGTVFKGKIILFDPKTRDDELIKRAIAAINEFGVGGWVNRGRGRVELKIVHVTEKQMKDLK